MLGKSRTTASSRCANLEAWLLDKASLICFITACIMDTGCTPVHMTSAKPQGMVLLLRNLAWRAPTLQHHRKRLGIETAIAWVMDLWWKGLRLQSGLRTWALRIWRMSCNRIHHLCIQRKICGIWWLLTALQSRHLLRMLGKKTEPSWLSRLWKSMASKKAKQNLSLNG